MSFNWRITMNHKMKRILYSLFLVFLFSHCAKIEDGIITPIDEVEISGIEESYTMANTDLLVIDPSIVHISGAAVDTADFTFAWIINSDTIGRNVGLNLQGLALATGTYSSEFKMTDRQTGVFYRQAFNIVLSSALGSGILLLTDVGGTARLDMLAGTSVSSLRVQNDVFGTVGSALVLDGQPYFLGRHSGTTSAASQRFFVGTSNGAYQFARNTYALVGDIANTAFVVPPANFTPLSFYEGAAASSVILTENEVYNATYATVTGPYFNTPINVMSGTLEPFKTSKYVVSYPNGNSAYGSTFVLFNEDDQAFYIARDGVLGATEMPTGTLFDYHIGKQLVYMGMTTFNWGNTEALLKDNDADRYYFARFGTPIYTGYDAIGAQLAYSEVTNVMPEIAQATHFAVENTYAYFYYAVGSRIYAYDSGNNLTRLMVDYGDRQVSMLRVNRRRILWLGPDTPYDTYLMVATYDESGDPSTSGRIDFYSPAALLAPMQLVASFDGMGKTVDALVLQN